MAEFLGYSAVRDGLLEVAVHLVAAEITEAFPLVFHLIEFSTALDLVFGHWWFSKKTTLCATAVNFSNLLPLVPDVCDDFKVLLFGDFASVDPWRAAESNATVIVDVP